MFFPASFLNRLRLCYGYLSEHKFRQNFTDTINSLFLCSLDSGAKAHFFLHKQNNVTNQTNLTNE